jgi:hypothetical protein
MSTGFLESLPAHEIVRYTGTGEYQGVSTAYDGAARKHPYDDSRILLVPSPLDHLHIIYEFQITDILHAEPLRNLGTESGENLAIVRLWVRHGSVGLKMEPFRIEPRQR